MWYVKVKSNNLQKSAKNKHSANALNQQSRINTLLPTTIRGSEAGQGNSSGGVIVRGGMDAKFLG